MFVRLFLILLILLGVMWFMGWYGKAGPEERNRAIRTGLLYLFAGALLLLVVSGRIPVIFAAISAAIPILHRLLAYRGVIGVFGRFAGRKLGTQTLTTRWLVVEYDLANSKLDAQVTRGCFEGKRLSEMEPGELDQLLDEVRDDFQSRAAVNAFILSRRGGAYAQNPPPPPSGDGKMSRSQAFEVLGLDADATEEEIKQAHKRLIQKLHPDRGGSSYLAMQINLAKDTLIKS